ncbi:uncharacterized protein K441DRAFT_50544 [Cenococcum geophilum 1.58]|uniref:uncharacterized protein n=1 Tax=Cenococcum geophilum 1.58 TaxID=794803 RepID=UPI00358E6B5A|nr:hypothetical protein K441DRAFT_50544 [Cenococcum geophilum 1.58]
MKCINEWRGTAGLIPTKPPRAFHGPHGEKSESSGRRAHCFCPRTSGSRRMRRRDQYFRFSARGKHKLLLVPSCLRTRHEYPAVQVIIQQAGPTERLTAQIKARRAGQQHPRSVSGIVSRLHSINGLRQPCLRHYYSFLISSLSHSCFTWVARRISDRG